MDDPTAVPRKTPSAAPAAKSHPARPSARARDVAARREDASRRSLVTTFMRRLSPPR